MFLIIACSLLGLSCNSSNKRNSENLVVKTINYQFSTTNKYADISDFGVTKEVLNDSVFKFCSILCSDTSELCDLKFWQKNNDWHIWSGKEWCELFKEEKKIINGITLDYVDMDIIPLEVLISEFDTLYSFRFEKKNISFSTDNNVYYFSPSYGIVMVNNEYTYIRNDYKYANSFNDFFD